MPRRRRKDYHGAWWHLINRGVAQRALFETAWEYRYFLALLAMAVRNGGIEVHAFCLMANHFHLLVRSPHGDISHAMQWVQDKYARRFNTRRDRTGPLFTGRFFGKQIQSLTYRCATIGYIHSNPVKAGVVKSAPDYLFSSARAYMTGQGTPWLSRQFGERLSAKVLLGHVVPDDLVERWLADPSPDRPDVDGLAFASSVALASWLRRNATTADGKVRSQSLVRPNVLEAGVARNGEAIQSLGTFSGPGRSLTALDTLRGGMLRIHAAMPLQALANQLPCSLSRVGTRIRAHRSRLETSEPYRVVAAAILQWCLAHEYAEIVH